MQADAGRVRDGTHQGDGLLMPQTDRLSWREIVDLGVQGKIPGEENQDLVWRAADWDTGPVGELFHIDATESRESVRARIPENVRQRFCLGMGI